jgi:putative iron-only hydrogenase system regulator
MAVLVTDRSQIQKINSLLSEFAHLMLGRIGIPIKDRGISVISLIIEGTTDEIGALTGKLGRLNGVEVKSTLTRYRGDSHEHDPESP